MATTNFFTTAKTVAKAAAKGKKGNKPVITIDGLEVYAAGDHLIKWFKSIIETQKAVVYETVIPTFIADGLAKKGRPENFNAVEGKGSANVQLRQRSSASGLTEIEIDLCEQYNVPVENVQDRPETFIINPTHLDWVMANSAKLSAALSKIPGCPADLLQKQEATTKTVPTEDALDFVFRSLDAEALTQLLPVVGTLALKPKFDTADDDANGRALEVIQKFFEGEGE